MIKTYKSLLVLLLCSTSVFAQNVQSQHFDLNWVELGEYIEDPEVGNMQMQRPLWCSDCKEEVKGKFFSPLITEQLYLGNGKIENLSLKNITTASYEQYGLYDSITNEFELSFNYLTIKGEKYANIVIKPLRRSGNQIEVLTSFDIQFNTASLPNRGTYLYKKDQTYTSVLSSGDVYKIAVAKSGIYKITASFLNSNGIDAASIPLNNFKIYGNGGVMLPEVIADDRAEDLEINAIYINDQNGNNRLDADDYILWYAQGPDLLSYNFNSSSFSYSNNDYSDKSYYFLKWDASNSLIIDNLPSNQSINANRTLTEYDYIIHHEEDEINHIHSGRIWWGDEMSGSNTQKNFSYTIGGLVQSENLRLEAITSARSLSFSNISIKLNNEQTSIGHPSVSGEFDANYTAGSRFSALIAPPIGENVTVSFSYSRPLSESKAWIDYFNLITKRELRAYGGQQEFFNTESAVDGYTKYIIEDASAYTIWNITDHNSPKIQQTFTENGNTAFISQDADNQLQRFILFRSSDANSPEYIGKVENQNIHGLSDIEYIIITAPSLKEEAQRLADFHEQRSSLTTAVVTTDQVFNEFSSGSQDVTAIRDLAKLLYDRGKNGAKELRFICLFGDASYDFKDRLENNTNLVPIYQSFNSYLPAASHCSDDYYAILDDNEGYWGLQGASEGLDIGVGRLPASNTSEAKIIVDKILNYHSAESFGNWINKLTFLGDDEDNNVHFLCSEDLTDVIHSQNPKFNQNKIWMDAFEQVSFGSGNKYPSVNAEVDKSIDQGTLIFNYVGHGGTNGMAHERVVTRPQIVDWNNNNSLAFYITASCELAAIDNPSTESPGELMMFNPNGGAIGMVATTRVVYIGANCDLNEDILNNNIFNLNGGEYKTLGDVYMETRNRSYNSGQVINKRSFMLFADPAMSLLNAPNKVVTTSINGVDFNSFSDTLRALSKVTIDGEIRDLNNSLMNNFNGVLYPTIYDKFATYQTRGNDPKSKVANFDAQNSIIYKGKISVSNGKFSFSFIMPKDIAYHYGEGKISYYANDAADHATSHENDVIIGGTTDSLKNDQDPPELKLFIDDRSWVFGGMTNFTPLLLADIYDENGINTVGSGIGREMEAILDEGTDNEQIIVLNEYFEPELNSYQAGTINYKFDNLPAGRHTLRLKVWDVYNNSAEGYTEFIIADDAEISIEHLLNYPNPFNRFTTFHFDHNKAGQNLVVNLNIYTISGKVVKSMTTTLVNAQSHSADLHWDGRDEFGDKLAQGVYLYQLEVKAEDGSTEKETQKLYILK